MTDGVAYQKPRDPRRNQAKGQANRQPPAGIRWCARCSRRYAQDATGLCRSCANETLGPVGTAERDRARQEARDAKLAALERVQPREPRPPRTYTARDGTEFEVVWDGT